MANLLGKKLLKVEKPARYIGGEYGVVSKDWDSAELKWCLAFPEVYEIGMSHLGLQILYSVLNNQENTLADRAYTPWGDMEKLLRSENQKLWGLQSGKTLSEFDVVGITIPYEMTYTNMLSLLDLGGIPLLAKDRNENDPLVIGGGCGAFNPEPIAEMFDAILLGDGEEAVLQISDIIIDAKKSKKSRKETIESLSEVEGLYIPSIIKDVGVARVSNLKSLPEGSRSLVPNIQLVHDRVGIEIQRGCTRGCRFCQAGMVYRPDRQKEKSEIISEAESVIDNSGLEECAFLSLSAGDYDNLPDVAVKLDQVFSDKWVHLSLPSLRTESMTEELIKVMSRSLKGGFTLAPEAATERLRRVINKGNSEEDLLKSVEKIFSTGWKNLKLYFMIGLPTETDEDIDAIPDLALKALKVGRQCHKFPNITVNVSTFVPKSHTPFQWEEQMPLERTKEIQGRLRDRIKGPGLKLKLHKPEVSFLEGVFARGDRELLKVIIKAHEKGCRFDSWEECLNLNSWLEAFDECKIDPNSYLSKRDSESKLSWDHLFTNLDRNFLRNELAASLEGELTPDCSRLGCVGCGVCDFNKVEPRIIEKTNDKQVCHREETEGRRGDPDSISDNSGLLRHDVPRNDRAGIPETRFKYRINFTKSGDMVFVGHLDFSTVWKRSLRRADLPLYYSQGFNPRPKFSFAEPLSVGVESQDEWCELELIENMDPEEVLSRLRTNLPKGINVKRVIRSEDKKALTKSVKSQKYRIEFEGINIDSRVKEFNTSDKIEIEKKSKKGLKKVDIKKGVIKLAEISDHAIEVELEANAPSITNIIKWMAADEDYLERASIIKEQMCLTN